MLLQRIIVTFTLGPLGLFLIYLGGLYYFVPVFLLLLLGAMEYTQLMKRLKLRVSPWLFLPLVGVMLVDGQWPDLNLFAPLTLLAVFLPMCYALWLYERRLSETVPLDWLATAGGVLLLGGVGSYFFRVRGVPEFPIQWTMLAMLGTWIADSGAFVVGKSMGRHKLSPRLSPNKTVEGYVGGIVLGTLFTVGLSFPLGVAWLPALVLGLLASVVSPAGDLGISLLKREAGVKDSGTFLPGHGGALDRIDSLIWSVAFAYFVAILL
ncbi:MAG: phosphatidate cytidylyltransferase [Ardenticatenaceae bacterium]|nr:phosphatidate cytidylyltransferase [Anaerolineales bacterium]MCB8916377.1 phosphatidate cytidylyltransferase [Ardenticatenaceae bacterium]